MQSRLTAQIVFFLCCLSLSILALPTISTPSLSLLPDENLNTGLTFSPNVTNLNAPPPPGFHIDGSSLYLPHKYRITFEHYGPPAPRPAALQCLHKTAVQFHQHRESDLMGVAQRTYEYKGIVIGIKPNPRLTWGYWGATIRAIDSMWKSWDVIELEFVIGVEDEGILGRGFLTSVSGES